MHSGGPLLRRSADPLRSALACRSQQSRVAHGTAAMVAFDYGAQRSAELPKEVVQLLEERARSRQKEGRGRERVQAKL